MFISVLQTSERKKFQKYQVDLPIGQLEKKLTMKFTKPKYLRIEVSVL